MRGEGDRRDWVERKVLVGETERFRLAREIERFGRPRMGEFEPDGSGVLFV